MKIVLGFAVGILLGVVITLQGLETYADTGMAFCNRFIVTRIEK
jgi:hypothetical protein